MRRHGVVPGLATLALAWTLALATAGTAAAARRPAHLATPAAPAMVASGPAVLAVGADTTGELDLRLARAVSARKLARPWDVIANLEPLDFSTIVAEPGGDRAAFLLAEAYREVGAFAAFDSLTERVAARSASSVFVRWILWLRTLDRVEREGGVAAAGSAEIDSVSRTLQALAGTGGADVTGLASSIDTTSVLGRDLAGALWMHAADGEARAGHDPRPLLANVPPGSREAADARELAAEAAIERGEVESGRSVLAAEAVDSLAAGHRRVLLELAAVAMDAGRWSEAESLYAAANRDWSGEHDALTARLAHHHFADLWTAWRGVDAPNALVLDGKWAEAQAARVADRAAGLEPAPPVAEAAPTPPAFRVVAPPDASDWTRAMLSMRGVTIARADTARLDEAARSERERLARFRRYLASGQVRLAREDSELVARGARLDSLEARLDAWDRQLRDVRDAAVARLVARTRAIRAEAEAQRVALHGLRQLRLAGPHRAWAHYAPTGEISPDTLLAVEDSLTAVIARTAARLEIEGPETIRRSYLEKWRPGLIDRVGALAGGTKTALAWERRVDHDVDSTLAAAETSPALRTLAARLAVATRRADSLAVADAALRDQVAAGAVTHALAQLDAEREGLDYGLAASTYAASVGLGANDSAATGATALETPEITATRRAAIARLRAFLADHPQSAARAEMRFRLADVVLLQTRGDFRDRMAEYVRRQSAGEAVGAVPILDDGGALDLYRAILREDSTFAHRDAVRFDAGMLLADAGDPAAEDMFLALVKEAPHSTYAPDAWVRIGDLRFSDHRFREAGDAYGAATSATDPTVRAVATYKLGWSAFRDERFFDAAVSFRDVLDLYAADRGAIRADVEKESESWLVQALMRSGGAESWARLFADAPRAYDHHVLLALAQQFRRYDRHADAIAADRMALERAPLSPDALLSARRMVDTYARWNAPKEQRDAMAELAPRFAPGGAWAQAQKEDSVRTAGAEFARREWLTLAAWHQNEARAHDDVADWRAALELWENVLTRWPDDPDAARDHLLAAEDAARLDRYASALAHAAAASRSSDDSLRTAADWQQAALADAWYEKRRSGHRDGFEPDVDSLARGVLSAADRYAVLHPQDSRVADLFWREGQVAFAHEWWERAATDLGRLAHAYPNDSRIPRAAAMRADATFRLGHFAEAGAAYEEARLAAAHAGEDTLAARMGAAVPICFYRDAEAAVEADSTNYLDHAQRFEKVAACFPSYEHADLAQYRAGRAYLKAKHWDDAVRAMTTLVAHFPKSEYARDANLEIARALEQSGHKLEAARALGAFASAFPGDTASADAMLHAADLDESAGATAAADSMRLAYVAKYPGDAETGMAVYEALARRELAAVDATHPLSALLPAEPAKPTAPAKAARGTRKAKAAPTPVATAASSRSYLAQYLKRAEAHPALASKSLLAEVRFRQGDEARALAAEIPLTLPLAASLPKRQKRMDEAIARYKDATAIGVTEWSNASACRMGETLVDFAQALERSEKPADLKGDDLLAYQDVLLDKAQGFYDRAEGVWGELVRQKGATTSKDTWVLEARSALWKRLGLRFAFEAEPEVPVVAAAVPDRPHAPKESAAEKQDRKAKKSRGKNRQLAGDTP